MEKNVEKINAKELNTETKLITRDGRKARFVAYVPEHIDGYRLLVFIEGESTVGSFYDDGKFYNGVDSDKDIFLYSENNIKRKTFKYKLIGKMGSVFRFMRIGDDKCIMFRVPDDRSMPTNRYIDYIFSDEYTADEILELVNFHMINEKIVKVELV